MLNSTLQKKQTIFVIVKFDIIIIILLHSHCLFQVQFPAQYRPPLLHWFNTWLEPKLAEQKHSNQCPDQLCLLLLIISIGVLRRITIDHHANSYTGAITIDCLHMKHLICNCGLESLHCLIIVGCSLI